MRWVLHGIPDNPVPVVLPLHGGPFWRGFWGCHAWHQLLANRGYAVVCVDFRGPTGFGKAFTSAGIRELGGKIIDDQVVAAARAVSRGIADPRKLAIMGISCGEFCALAGLTFHPDLSACAVDLQGPPNLVSLLGSGEPAQMSRMPLLAAWFVDPRSEEGRDLLMRQSPITYMDRICRPLQVVQGVNDARVSRADSDRLVEAMTGKGTPVTCLLHPDEGHGPFVRPQNNRPLAAVIEAFLAKSLGGCCEPIGALSWSAKRRPATPMS